MSQYSLLFTTWYLSFYIIQILLLADFSEFLSSTSILIDHQIFHFRDNEPMKSRVIHLNQIFIKSPVNVYDFLLLAFYFRRILRMLRTLFHCPWEVRDRRQSREAGSRRSKTSGTSKLYNRFHNSPITLSMRETRLGAFQRSASCLSIVTRTISVVR